MEYLILQLSPQRVTAARFGVSGRQLTFAGAAEFTLDHEQELAAVAERIGTGMTGSPRVVLCLPPNLFAQRRLTLPLTDLRKVREVVPVQLQGEIALPIDEIVIDALPVADGTWLAAWTRREEVHRAIEMFREAGCEPQVVSSAPFAWPLLPECPSDAVICGDDALAVISAGRICHLAALHGVNRGRQVASILAALEASGMAVPERLIVFGEQADTLSLPESLACRSEQLDLPESLGATFKNEQTYQKLAGLAAVALACQAGRLPDFRRGDLAWTADDSALRRKMMITCALAVVAVLLLFVSQGLQYRTVMTDIASLNASIATMYREIFPNRAKAVDEVSEVKGEIKKLSASSGGAGMLDLLKTLAESKGAGINGLFEAELDGRTIRIKGDARSSQAVTEFKTALAALFASVDVGEVKSRPDGGTTFTLTATVKEAKQ